MIIKVQTDAHKDRFLVEAAFINWPDEDDILAEEEERDFVILEIHIVATQAKRAGTTAIAFTGIEEEPSLRMKIFNGDRVFIMNNDGKTIDSKHIALDKKKETCEDCHYIKVADGAEWCTKHDKRIYSLSSRRCDLWEWKGPS